MDFYPKLALSDIVFDRRVPALEKVAFEKILKCQWRLLSLSLADRPFLQLQVKLHLDYLDAKFREPLWITDVEDATETKLVIIFLWCIKQTLRLIEAVNTIRCKILSVPQNFEHVPYHPTAVLEDK